MSENGIQPENQATYRLRLLQRSLQEVGHRDRRISDRAAAVRAMAAAIED